MNTICENMLYETGYKIKKEDIEDLNDISFKNIFFADEKNTFLEICILIGYKYLEFVKKRILTLI